MMLFMAALGGATVGFLVYNFNPASIFMVDAGSMFLGYVLAVALGLPIADTAGKIRRAVKRQPMFRADRAHIHHKLLNLGLSQKQAVLALYGASILLGGMAYC